MNDLRIATEVDADGDSTFETVERFVLDGGNLALVLDGAGAVTQRYVHGPGSDEVLAEETVGATNTVQWLLADNQGSVRDVVDSSGTSVDHIVYDSFGNIASRTSSTYALRFGYTGRELASEAGDGMWYYRRRFYDATVGRFISQDPSGFNAGDVNLYRYVTNSPLNYTDPSGLTAESGLGADDLKRMALLQDRAALFDWLMSITPRGDDYIDSSEAQSEAAFSVARMSLLRAAGDMGGLYQAVQDDGFVRSMVDLIQGYPMAAGRLQQHMQDRARQRGAVGTAVDTFGYYGSSLMLSVASPFSDSRGQRLHEMVGHQVHLQGAEHQVVGSIAAMAGVMSDPLAVATGGLAVAGGKALTVRALSTNTGRALVLSTAMRFGVARSSASVASNLTRLEAKIAARTATRAEWQTYSRQLRLVKQPVKISAKSVSSDGFVQFSRRATARQFLAQQGWQGRRIGAALSGIDFSRPVSVVTIPRGAIVEQWVKAGRVGKWFAPLNQSPELSGIWRGMRTPIGFQAEDEVTALRSTARSITDTWTLGPNYPVNTPGGGIQYLVPNNQGLVPYWGY